LIVLVGVQDDQPVILMDVIRNSLQFHPRKALYYPSYFAANVLFTEKTDWFSQHDESADRRP
jgi:hypothetical protein